MLLSVATLRHTRCILAWVCLPVVVFWSFGYVTLTLLTAHTPPPTTVNPLDELVDRDAVCDRLQRGLLDPEHLNTSVLGACRRWIAAQTDFFRPRRHRVNTFGRRLLKTGDGICSDRTFMVVVIHSLHTHRDRRTAIRETWGGAAVAGMWPNSLSPVCISYQNFTSSCMFCRNICFYLFLYASDSAFANITICAFINFNT